MPAEKCLICNQEFKGLKLHVRNKHGMSYEDYKKDFSVIEEVINRETPDEVQEPVEPFDEIEQEIPPADSTTHKDVQHRIFNTGDDSNLDVTLRSFLESNQLTVQELNGLINRYKKGDAISVVQNIASRQRAAKTFADSLKDLDEAYVNDLFTAEDLCKNHGFRVVDVRSKPKTWVLKKFK